MNRKFITSKLDLIAAIMVASIGVIILLLSYFWQLSQQDIGIVVLLASLTYFILRKRTANLTEDTEIKPYKTLILLASIVFWVTFSASLLVLKFSLYIRPPLYFVLVSVAAVSIAVQVFSVKDEISAVWVILLQITLLSLSVRAGLFYEFPTLIGVDTWFHVGLANSIAGYGHIPPQQVYNSGTYVSFPFFHLLVAATQVVTGTIPKDAVFFSVISADSVILVLAVYSIGKHLGDARMGLFAALIAGFADMILVIGVTNINPGLLILGWFLLVMLMLYQRSLRPANILLVIFLFWIMMLTHQLTVFASLMAFIGLLIGKWLYEYLYKHEHAENSLNVSFGLVTLFSVSMLFYWMYFTHGKDSFFVSMAKRLIGVLSADLRFTPSESLYAGKARGYSMLSNALYHPGYLILLFLAVIGVLVWLSRRKIDGGKLSIILAVLVLYLFVYGAPLTSLENVFLPQRWLPFVYVLLIPAAAQGIMLLIHTVAHTWSKVCVGVVIIMLGVFFMMTTPYVANGSAIYDQDRSPRTGYKESETQAAASIVKTYNGGIMLDVEYYRPFSNGEPNSGLQITQLKLDLDNSFHGVVVLRRSLLTEPTQISAAGSFAFIRSVVLGQEYFDMVNKMPGASLVYDSGEVTGYLLQ